MIVRLYMVYRVPSINVPAEPMKSEINAWYKTCSHRSMGEGTRTDVGPTKPFQYFNHASSGNDQEYIYQIWPFKR